MHDGHGDGDSEVEPVDDKRLWIVEAEFANVMAQGKREGNTLLPALRDVWDGGSIKPLTKGKGLWSTDPHIAIHGNITPGELRDRLQKREVLGGTFNRFIWCWAERTSLVALPPPTDDSTVTALAERIAQALRFACGRYPTSRESRRAELDAEAADFYTSVYGELRAPHPAGELVAAATERSAPICLRVALLHAILHHSLTITRQHVEVGYRWAMYSRDTTAYVLDTLAGEARNTEAETKLIAFLRERPKHDADRRTLTRECFKGHVSGEALDRVLRPLLDDGLIIRREEELKAGGRKRIVYQLANNANSANNQSQSGLARFAVGANNANYDAVAAHTQKPDDTPPSPAWETTL